MAAPVIISAETQPAHPVPSPLGRLLSLDLFRGATIAAMILVNDAGDEPAAYSPLQHAKWNGWTPTDLVFPFFLFIVGVAMALSFSSRLQRGNSRRDLMRHVLWRGLILFLLGVVLNGAPHFHLATWRIYGVLQRIAICYVISAVFALWSSRQGQFYAVVTCLLGYWILMRYVSVPGFGVPTHAIPLLDPDRNLAAWLDRKVLLGHLYEGTRDPEGILSTIPAIATSLLGVQTGEWLRSARSARAKAAGMALFGVIGVAAAEIFRVWFPINKKLWTSSYVLLTAGLALLALAICYWLVDIRKWLRGTMPVLVFGMNPIAAYVFADMLAIFLGNMTLTQPNGTPAPWETVIYQRYFASIATPPNASLLYALAFVLVCWLAMYPLYRNRIFLKI